LTNFTQPPTPDQLRHGEALWGSRPQAEPSRPKMRLVDFKRVVKGSLRGFATIALPIGLTIYDIPVLVSHNKAWASLPSKAQIDKEGRQKRDPNGKPAYALVLQWRDRSLSERFSNAVIELVRDADPDALDGE
jgi:hypothetical protein